MIIFYIICFIKVYISYIGNGLCVLETANGTGIIISCFLNKLALGKHFNSGLNGFEVTDNGKGIKEADFAIVCKRGTTSKIQDFSDIYSIKSLGFRGEALSSLCNIG